MYTITLSSIYVPKMTRVVVLEVVSLITTLVLPPPRGGGGRGRGGLPTHIFDEHGKTHDEEHNRKNLILRTSHQRPKPFIYRMLRTNPYIRVSNFSPDYPKAARQPSVDVDAAIIVEVGIFEPCPPGGTASPLSSFDAAWIVE